MSGGQFCSSLLTRDVVAGPPVAVRPAAAPVPAGDREGGGGPFLEAWQLPGPRSPSRARTGRSPGMPRRPLALLVAAGIGVTALRSLLEDLPRGSAPVVRSGPASPRTSCSAPRSATGEAPPRDDPELVGSRAEAASTRSRCRLVPDLAQRDVYVCGPEGFVAAIVDTARNLGIPTRPSTTRIRALTGRQSRGRQGKHPMKRASWLVARDRGRVPGRDRAAQDVRAGRAGQSDPAGSRASHPAGLRRAAPPRPPGRAARTRWAPWSATATANWPPG